MSLAFVRVAQLAEPFVFSDSPRYGGCRSWITLPEFPAAARATAVLDDTTHRAREQAIRAVLG